MPVCPSCRQQHDAGVAVCPNDGEALAPDDELRPRQETLEEGTAVGEYVVEGHIGAGAYGDVYAAEHPIIGKRAAVKVLHRRYSSQAEVISRFIAEARAVNTIRHRNIVDIFSFGQLADGRHYLIMELLEGQTLAAKLLAGPLALGEALELLSGIADALDAAHEAGIAHRDLKPDNIFLVDEGKGKQGVKLLDFGIAKLLGDAPTTHKTATGTAVGTPLYMAPEQARGRKVDERADVYAFGVVTFQLLSGTPPFDGESAIDVLFMHMTAPPPRLSSLGLPPELDAPLEAMLAKKPRDRPASAGAGLAALMEAAATCDLTRAVAIAKGYAPSTRKVVRTNPKVSLPTPKLGSEPASADPQEVGASLSGEHDELPETVTRPSTSAGASAAKTEREGDARRTAETLPAALPPAADTLESPALFDDDEPAATTLVAAPAFEDDPPELVATGQDATGQIPPNGAPPRWLIGVGLAAIGGILLLTQLHGESAQPTTKATTTALLATQAATAPMPSTTPHEEATDHEPSPEPEPSQQPAEGAPDPEVQPPEPVPAPRPNPRKPGPRPPKPAPSPPPPAVDVDDLLNARD